MYSHSPKLLVTILLLWIFASSHAAKFIEKTMIIRLEDNVTQSVVSENGIFEVVILNDASTNTIKVFCNQKELFVGRNIGSNSQPLLITSYDENNELTLRNFTQIFVKTEGAFGMISSIHSF